MSNKYFKGAKISEWVFRRVVRGFAEDQTATQTAQATGLTPRSVNPIFLRIRERIAEFGDVILSAPSVQVGIFPFSPSFIRKANWRGPKQKFLVLVLYAQDNKVFLETIPDRKKTTIYPILHVLVSLEVEIRTNMMRTFDGLRDLGFQKHIPTKGGVLAFREDLQLHETSEIQQFCSATQRAFKKFRGLPMSSRRLHLKERAFRHNYHREDLYLALLELLRNHPL